MIEEKYILGIESSCDDTSVALLEIKNKNIVDCLSISSSHIQAKYGGVVPEFSAREHEKNFIPLLDQLMTKNEVSWSEVKYIAYTDTPGLVSSLLTGRILAQTLGLIFNKKIIPVNHIYGHIFSIGLTDELKFPFLSLVVSGKTSAMYYVRSAESIELLDSTHDCALGEAYDKVARTMGLEYPGGPKIDKLFNKNLNTVPLLNHQLNPQQPFSYSGIMSAAQRMWKQIENNSGIINKQEYLSTVFQRFVVETLIKKIIFWSEQRGCKSCYVSGGVAHNSYLRERLRSLKMDIKISDKKYSSDNAAMIAYFASWII